MLKDKKVQFIFKKRLTLVFKVITCTHLNQNEKQYETHTRQSNPPSTILRRD